MNNILGKLGRHWIAVILLIMVMIGFIALIIVKNSGFTTANANPATPEITPANNNNVGAVVTPASTNSATPGVTPANNKNVRAGVTPAATNLATPGVTPAATNTPDPGVTPTATPVGGSTATATPGITPTATSGVTPTATPVATPTATPVGNNTVTVWIQVTDSCQEALSGATFTVVGPGISTTTAATFGTTPRTLAGGVGCPIQQGDCITSLTGCVSIDLNIPSSSPAIYTITVAQTAPGQGANLSYAICTGGSDCAHGPEVATVVVSASGFISATVLNPYPDGTTVTWPTNKSAYSGTASDPILFHEFGIGNGSIQCDGDSDADDYLTGTPGSHCDSDGPHQ